MSLLEKSCPADASSATFLWGRDECKGTNVRIPIDTLPNRPANVDCDIVASCPSIAALQAKDADLQSQINGLNTQTQALRDKDDALDNDISDVNDAISAITNQITEINQNITIIKGWNIRQDQVINSLQNRVIRDTTSLDFDERVQEVYIPQCALLDNKFSMGDLYINVNQNVASTNSTYVNVRPADSTAPCSAADWQELFYSSPADVLTIIGIDPIEVSHPYRNEWVISIDPDKLEDLLSKLDKIDFCDVNLHIGNIYGCGENEKYTNFNDNVNIEEDLTVEGDGYFKEDITVDNTANIGDLIVERNTNLNGNVTLGDEPSDEICIKGTIVCPLHIAADTIFDADVTVDGTLKVRNFVTEEVGNTHVNGDFTIDGNLCVNGTVICNITFDGDSTFKGDVTIEGTLDSDTVNVQELHVHNAYFNNEIFINAPIHYDVTFTDNVNIDGSLVVNNNLTTTNLTVEHNATFEEMVTFNGAVVWKDPTDPTAPEVCVDNVYKNLFRPSYGMFTLSGSGSINTTGPQGLLGIGTNLVDVFNASQGADRVPYSGTIGTVTWNQVNYTPGVELAEVGGQNIIRINDPGVYQISFHMTAEITGNVYAHRAGVVLFDQTQPGSGYMYIIDDKHAKAPDSWTMTHTHGYYDSDSWGTSQNRTTNATTITSYDRCEQNGPIRSNVTFRSDDHYTYSASALVSVTQSMVVAPYIKPSAGCTDKNLNCSFTITNGSWGTGSPAFISIHKIANLGYPYEYNC